MALLQFREKTHAVHFSWEMEQRPSAPSTNSEEQEMPWNNDQDMIACSYRTVPVLSFRGSHCLCVVALIRQLTIFAGISTAEVMGALGLLQYGTQVWILPRLRLQQRCHFDS
jgi:hypothetical protein